MQRASQILTGLARLASRDCSWLRDNPDLHAELLALQDELRETAAEVTGDTDLGLHLMEAHIVGTQLGTLFQETKQQNVAETHGLAAS